jgi:cardiolipin synthase
LRTRLFRNLPNLLTVLRLILVPVIIRALCVDDFKQALLLVFVAGASDALDGYLARRFHWESRTGAYIDPIGDKLLLVSLYVTLGLRGVIPAWLMWLILGRDVLILGMVAIAFLFTSVRSFPPSVWGKISTIVQVFTALAVIAGNAYSREHASWLIKLLAPVTAAATIWSGVHYTWLALQRFPAVRK